MLNVDSSAWALFEEIAVKGKRSYSSTRRSEADWAEIKANVAYLLDVKLLRGAKVGAKVIREIVPAAESGFLVDLVARVEESPYARSRDDAGKVSFDSIVFVHGLGGSPSKTWQKFPAILRRKYRLSAKNVASFGYRSRLVGVPLLGGRIPPLREVSMNLHTYLSLQFPAKRVLLVGHSLGCLILMSLAREYKRTIAPSYRLAGECLFAPPLQGTIWADIASRVPWSGRHINELGYNDQAMLELVSYWSQSRVPTQIPTMVIAGSGDKLVPPSSLEVTAKSLGVPLLRIEGATHTSLVKPKAPEDHAVLAFDSLVATEHPMQSDCD